MVGENRDPRHRIGHVTTGIDDEAVAQQKVQKAEVGLGGIDGNHV